MRWSALRWLALVVALSVLEGQCAKAAPSFKNEDMFRELLKLDQMYSSIARPRFGKRTDTVKPSQANFAVPPPPPLDYEGQRAYQWLRNRLQNDDAGDWLPVRR